MKMGSMFRGDGNLRGLLSSSGGPINVESVVHKVFIEVSKGYSEPPAAPPASARSEIFLTNSSYLYKPFILNRTQHTIQSQKLHLLFCRPSPFHVLYLG